MSDSASPLEPPPRVLEFLADHTTLTLATASPAGVPRATDLRYVSDGLTLYVWTRSQSWTAKQIDQNPLISFTISEETRMLQGGGEARSVISGDEVARAVELFSAKFPTALGASTMNISFFRITPTSVQLVDETYGGGRGETQMFEGAEYHVDAIYDVTRDLPASEVGAITGRLQKRELSPGTVIAREGTPADKFLIVLDGELAVTRDGETVMSLGPGQFFGEVAILTDAPRSATLTAVGEATVLAMERDEFRSVVAQSLGTTADFDRIVRERLGGGESR
jgi:uncharacterized protein YhbP (UPF0306 family)